MLARSETPSRIFVFLASIVVLAVFYFAREILVPLALTALFSFLLEPLVRFVQRWGLGRTFAICFVMTGALVVIVALCGVVVVQVADLFAALPTYASNFHAKIDPYAVRISQAVAHFSETAAGLARPAIEPPLAPTTASAPAVAPAEPARSLPPAAQFLLAQAGTMTHPLLTAGIVTVLVAFTLAQRQDLRDRLIRLIGSGRTHITIEAFEEAASRVSRYLLLYTITNGAFAVVIGFGLYLIGVPNAALWGALSGVLRYIPYFGAWMAPILPFALALGHFDGWAPPLMVVALYVVVELTVANVLEPWLYGSGTGLSPLAVLFAAIFWTWMWGAVGLLLSIPLTVCMLVIGKYVPTARFLHILLGDEPVLEPHMRFYQRLLALDDEEASQIVAEQLKDANPASVYEGVMIPALECLNRDATRGELDDRKRQLVLTAVREFVGEIAEGGEPSAEPRGAGAESCICIGATSEADELAAEMFCDAARRSGHAARLSTLEELAPRTAADAQRHIRATIIVSVVAPTGVSQARHVVRRLLRAMPSAPIVVGFWNTHLDEQRAQERLDPQHRARAVRNFAGALTALGAASGAAERSPSAPPPTAPDRIAATVLRGV